MTSVYLFCLTLGFAFTLLSAGLGHFLGGDGGHGGADQGPDFSHSFEAGGDVGHAGVGEGDVADATTSGSLHLPILSPTVLSFFAASFGGTGLLFEKLWPSLPGWVHASMAAGSAAGLGFGLAYLLFKITNTLEANRVARASDALTSQAEVTVSVPKEGVGEIAYVSANTRQTLTAKTADGKEHKQGSMVRVLKVTDGIAYVSETMAPSLVSAVSGQQLPAGEPVRRRERS